MNENDRINYIAEQLASLQAQINNLSYALQGQGHDRWYVYNDGKKREHYTGMVGYNIQSADIYFKINNMVIQLIIDGKNVIESGWGKEFETESQSIGFYSHNMAEPNPIKRMECTEEILLKAKKEAIPISEMSVPMQKFYDACVAILKTHIHNL